MMVRPPRVPVDLQAQTRFVKERVERAIAELEQVAQQTDPISQGRHVKPLADETRNPQRLHRDEVGMVALKFCRRLNPVPQQAAALGPAPAGPFYESALEPLW
jgi:hypothetical protein